MGYGDEQLHPGYLLLTGLGCAFVFYRLYLWVREAQPRPDPWEPEIEASLQQGDTVPVCLKCSAPQPPGQWFCEHCGTAVGPYNNLMPYVNAFSQGEVLRNGVTARVRPSPLILAGYLCLSLDYMVFAPLYWFLFLRNLRRSRVVPPLDPTADPSVPGT